MIWKRSALFALLTITGLAIETSVLGSTTLLGARPELLLLVTIVLAMSEGPSVGMSAGFVMGLATDIFLSRPQGLTALTFMLAGYAVGRIRAQLQAPTAWLPVAMVFATTLVAVLFYGFFTLFIGQGPSAWLIVRAAVFGAIYNGLLTPFAFQVVRSLAARMRPTKVMP